MSILQLLSRRFPAQFCQSSGRIILRSKTVPQDLQKSFLRDSRRCKATSRKYAYPERLLLYHEGAARTTFIGCIKVITFFSFNALLFLGAPMLADAAHENFQDEERLRTVIILVTSAVVPLVYVAYTTKPFVNSVHLNLPIYARQSREMLVRYSKNLPPNASLHITGLNLIGRPLHTTVKVSDLFPKKSRFGIGNYARESSGKWFSKEGQTLFGIHADKKRMKDAEIWGNISKMFRSPA